MFKRNIAIMHRPHRSETLIQACRCIAAEINQYDVPEKFEDINDGETLCKYCEWTDRGELNRGPVVCYGGQPLMCEGSGCKDAYEYYLDGFKEERPWLK